MKEAAFWLYRLLTNRNRRRLKIRLQLERSLPIAILFYHRVADTHPNAWTLSRRDFARQLDWLQENYGVVSLAEAQRRVQANFCDRPTVALTFDDGYSDNADFAIPELVRRNLPATYFVATDFVRTGKPFPHDRAAGLTLEPNTIDELRNFVESGIEIGAHTQTHADLGALADPADLREEIVGSVATLERWLDLKIRYFAFPYGFPQNVTSQGVDIIREAGLAGFCTAYGALNWSGNPGFHLRRIHADPGIERLKNWLTLDQRKLHDNVQLAWSEPCPEMLAPIASESSGCLSATQTHPV